MANVRLYLDTRVTGNSPAHLKISVRKKDKVAYLSTGVSIRMEQWDKVAQRVINHNLADRINYSLAQKLLIVQEELLKREVEVLPITKIRQHLVSVLYPDFQPEEKNLFANRLRRFTELKRNTRVRFFQIISE